MNFEIEVPKNSFYRALLLVGTLFIVLAYAWITARFMEPELHLPQSVDQAVWVDEGQVNSLMAIRTTRGLEIADVLKELGQVDSSLSVIGGLDRPVVLLITSDDQDRLLVTDSRIEIGSRLAKTRGHLRRAFVKAWVLQMAASRISSSYLRTEIATDVLHSMLAGHLELADIETKDPLHFLEVDNWLRFARSFDASCSTPWQGLELRSLCHLSQQENSVRSTLASPLSFRPLLGSILWSVFNEIPMLKRVDFIRKWASHLRTMTSTWSKAVATQEAAIPRDLMGWRDKLRSEVETFLPSDRFAEVAESLERVVRQARLKSDQSPIADVVFKANGITDVALDSFVSTVESVATSMKLTVLLQTDDGLYSIPGKGLVASVADSEIEAKTVVWEDCRAPRVKDVLRSHQSARSVIFVKNCGGEDFELPLSAQYAPILRGDVATFAQLNPSVAFMQLKSQPMKFASERKVIKENSLLTDLLKNRSAAAPELGLREAQWQSEAKAFKNVGAIEAIEWFRDEDQQAESL